MMILHVLNNIDGLNHLHHSVDIALSPITVLAQQTDVNLIRDTQKAWSNLIRTGQLAAFFVGLIVGWALKGLLP